MCITSTARRRNLTLQVLPSHLLTAAKPSPSSDGGATRTTSSLAAPPKGFNNFFQQQHVQTVPMPQATMAIAPPEFYDHEHSHPHVVTHDYHDHSGDPIVDPSQIKHKAKGGVITPFPVKLHEMLDKIEEDGLAHVVSWQPHGRCFVVHKPKEFVNHVMPKYFKQTKIASFQRQLNLYGFNRLTGGLDKGGYYHELFLRGKVSLAYDINRMRVKGTGVRLPTNPDNEPNFYAFVPVTKTNVTVPKPASTKSNESKPSPISSKPSFTEVKSAPSPFPTKPLFDLAERRAQLRHESFDHARKISAAASFYNNRPKVEQAQQVQSKKEEEDLVFFEGCPFHYLDPSALAPIPEKFEAPPQMVVTSRPAPVSSVASFALRPNRSRQLSHSTSTVVSDSEEDVDFVPSFSAASMDWEGPLSAPSIQAHMRRSSFQSFNEPVHGATNVVAVSTNLTANVERKPLEDDVETFFTKFEMPVDLYHEQIERMSESDDTAFGFLLEQAISE